MSSKKPLFSIASWNINSVRLRQNQVISFLKEHQPDVLALQETKTPDEFFPEQVFKDAGYSYVIFNGMKSYNGVCFISKHPLTTPVIHQRVGQDDCRHLEVTCTVDQKHPIKLHNLYIPAGGDEPDRETNPKFDHKLKFVDEMTAFFPTYHDKDDAVITLGDFNIAPHENDVWSHKQLLKIISHTPIEVEKLNAMKDAFDWTDVARFFAKDEDKLYSWWSYRARDWQKSNRGRRLDHIWVSPHLKKNLKDFKIISEMRGIEKPSDHVPIITFLEL